MKVAQIVILYALILIGYRALIYAQKEQLMISLTRISSINDVNALIPQSPQEIEECIIATKSAIRKQIKQILSVPPVQRTFENTALALDRTSGYCHTVAGMLQLLQMVHPDVTMRQAAQQAFLALEAFMIDTLSHNIRLFNALQEYIKYNALNEKLSSEEQYYLKRVIHEGERNGLHLPAKRRNTIKMLYKELATVANSFDVNIHNDNRTITVPREGLKGLSEEFIATLKQDEQGNYFVGIDRPTYEEIMERCLVEQTRKQLWDAYMNRAYPANEKILEHLIVLRDELARRLNYKAFSDFTLSDQMAKSVAIVKEFLQELQERIQKKVTQEVSLLLTDLPESVQLTEQGHIKPWDSALVKAFHKRKSYNVDEKAIAEYFPLEHTLLQLLSIYESFFNITFEYVTIPHLWHSDVRAIAAYNPDKELLGYLLLDLFPRENKYNHACELDVISPIRDKEGNYFPAFAVVITNFPKPTEDRPSLLKRTDVNTFFHEFGHALHTLLGVTELTSFSGTHVKRDFVEMPSQMLEEWLWDPAILKKVSAHYQTGQPLPDDLIESILRTKHFDSGDWVARQAYFAFLSLLLFEGIPHDIQALKKTLHDNLRPHIAYEPEHMECSFGHLTGYDARYYSYLWSKVFALDLFSAIKPHGLLNPEIGMRYAQEVLGKGGSVEPSQLLLNFLGRSPNSNAFFCDLGIEV